MTKERDALKLALEALENAWLDASMGKGDVARHTEAITAIREALAEQPAQRCPLCNYQHGHAIGCENNPVDIALAKMAEQPAQQQEPVAWRWTESNGQHWFDWRTDWTHHDRAKAMGFAIEYAYTSPPASKPWVGLTEEEKTEIRLEHYARTLPLMDAVETKLREKNGWQ